MTQRTPLMTTVMLTLALAAAAPSTVWADETPLLKVRPFFEPSKPRPLFAVAPLAAAAQSAVTTTTGSINRQFGVGIRLGVEDPSFGGSVRYFFYGGPLGVQGELSVTNVDFFPDDIKAVRFSPSVIYRWLEYKFNGPVSLTPYGGAGLSFVSTRFDEDVFGPDLNDTNLGVLLYGGVELFFDKAPNIGVSGELTFSSNDDVDNVTFGRGSLGGATFTAAGHWYFW